MVNAFYLNQYISTTLSAVGGINDSQTTGIILASVTNITTDKPGVCVITYTDPLDTTKAEWVTYTSIDSSNELQGVTRGQEGYSAKSHDNGATIAFPLSESHINNLNDALIIGGVETNLVDGTLDEDDMATNSATKLATQQSIKAYVDANAGSVDGWTESTDTWVYASASTFTIAGVDRTAVYTKGTRLKFTQTTAKYAVVVSSSFSTDTTVTIAVNTDYTIANAAITSPFYSYQAIPQGYPDWFNFTVVWKTGFSADPGVDFAIFKIDGRQCFFKIECNANGTSNSNRLEINLPVIPARTFATSIVGYGVDNNAIQNAIMGCFYNIEAPGFIQLDKTNSQSFTGWTASGAKSANVEGNYEI